MILLSYNEIGLKKDNRWYFEKKLIQNIRQRTEHLGLKKIENLHKKFLLEYTEENETEALRILSKIFGIHRLQQAEIFPLEGIDSLEAFDRLKKAAIPRIENWRRAHPRQAHSFRVSTKRINKNYPMFSTFFSAELGGWIVEHIQDLIVDLHTPDFIVNCEIHKGFLLCALETVEGPGGLPTGTSGKALLMLSGGIDSPVAGWCMAKRGLTIGAVHFHTPPFTSLQLLEKIKRLGEVLADYQNKKITIFFVNITTLMQKIRQVAPPEYTIIFQRRAMLFLAQEIAQKFGFQALISGDNLGQVASQTLENLCVQDQIVQKIPIFRPLIANEKYHTVALARQIGSFNISIEPIEDCCALFVPRHPVIKAQIQTINQFEPEILTQELIDSVLQAMEIVKLELP